MIILTSTDSIIIKLAVTVSANQADIVANYRDLTTTTYTPGRQLSASNNTSDVTIVTAPAASTQRLVDFISIYNRDTAAISIEIRLFNGTTSYRLVNILIPEGQTLIYSPETGFIIQGTGGYQPILSVAMHNDGSANFIMTNATNAERLALGATRQIVNVDLAGYSQVKWKVNIQTNSASPNTPRIRIKYATTYTGTIGSYFSILSSGELETSVAATGYYDSGWLNMATGARIANCYIAMTELGGDAAADPAVGHSILYFR